MFSTNYPTMQKKIENIEAFVRQNAPYMTLKDMMDESGWSANKIKEIMDRVKIKPLNHKDKIRNFILEHYRKKTKKWMAKALDFCDQQVSSYYRELGIEEPHFPDYRNHPIGETISERLGHVRHPDSRHYHDAENFRLL